MFTEHYYHGTIKKMVAVFGALFNNLSVVRKNADGGVVNITRVPLSYGPKQKFLTRIDEQPDADNQKVAIKLPRMSFEYIGLTYDPTMKINRNQKISVSDSSTTLTKKTIRTFAPYKLLMQLSIMAKNQDDALQILEQILPNFQPEYSVTIKDVEGMGISNDVPIILTGVNFVDSYEGTPEQRRVIVITLDFELRVRFFGPVIPKSVIKSVDVSVFDDRTGQPIENINVFVDPPEAGPNDEHQIKTVITYLTASSEYALTLSNINGTFEADEPIFGSSSGTGGWVKSVDGTNMIARNVDGLFEIHETIVGETSGATATVSALAPRFE